MMAAAPCPGEPPGAGALCGPPWRALSAMHAAGVRTVGRAGRVSVETGAARSPGAAGRRVGRAALGDDAWGAPPGARAPKCAAWGRGVWRAPRDHGAWRAP
ncbi:hypothetical protein GCM10009727_96060 [Actinomadura napierensis]|uniref:Uncharacterized protein n=1 Tax=Actinomadura napierensis TaxID=267854 RepID=A0ABN3AK82_9ACTN